MYVYISTSTGDEAVVYKSVPVQEPQYREDFLKRESQFSALTQFTALPAPFPARGKLDAARSDLVVHRGNIFLFLLCGAQC